MLPDRSKNNNFDLLRLFAALQVAFWHAREHLSLPSSVAGSVIYATRYFPGLQILFIISGFLVFQSYERAISLKTYLRNRFLRIYPGLWVCFILTVAALFTLGFLHRADAVSAQFWGWVAAQLTVFQFYTPDMLRPFGVGNPNGALWTIPVELSFYLLVPFIFWLCRRVFRSMNAWLLLFITMSVLCNILYQPYKFSAERSTAVKLLGVSLAPYLFYFLLGAITAHNWQRLRGWHEGKGLIWIAAYLAWSIITGTWLHLFTFGYWTNLYHFISTALLSQAVVSLAYSLPSLAGRLLRHRDLSYGIYIYHMPVINIFIASGLTAAGYAIPVIIGAILILSWLSWTFAERPALSLKNRVGG